MQRVFLLIAFRKVCKTVLFYSRAYPIVFNLVIEYVCYLFIFAATARVARPYLAAIGGVVDRPWETLTCMLCDDTTGSGIITLEMLLGTL